MEDKDTNPEKTHSDNPDAFDDHDDLTAELVAYLDGEQDQYASEQTGGKISLDPTIRAEADALKKTWDLLDYLPRPEPSPDFTERTMSRVEPVVQTAPTLVTPARSGTGTRVRASSGDVLNQQPPRRSRRNLAAAAGWLLAIAAAGVSGYFARSYFVEHRQDMDQQEKDARILSQGGLLQNLRYYRHIDDLKFLIDLDNPELFGEERITPANEGPK
jgi:hypothetical protein